MIEIVLSVCLLQQPNSCKDVNMHFLASGMSQRQCMLNGQHEISKWMEGNPNWGVKKWRCGLAHQVAKL